MALIRSNPAGRGCGSHAKGMLTGRSPGEGRDQRRDCSRRHAGPSLAQTREAVGQSGGRVGRREWSQEGRGRARSRARALLNWFLPGPALGQVQGEAARLAGDASGQGEEASPQGLGGRHRLAQTDARCPAGQIVGDDPVSSTGRALDGEPGAVGGEAARGEMVEPHAVLQSLPRT